jgi:hypothetical protein
MRHFAARQGSAGRLWFRIWERLGITEGHHPLIVHQEEIENRQVKVTVPCAGSQLGGICTGCIQELTNQHVVRRYPGQRLQGEQLCRFLGVFHATLCGFPPERVRYSRRGPALERIS